VALPRRWACSLTACFAVRRLPIPTPARLVVPGQRARSPGPIEEWVFFDHPSGRSRIYAAMRWKAENLKLMSEPPGQKGEASPK